MGCGPCSYSQISQNTQLIHQKLLRRVRFIRQMQFTDKLGTFLTIQELRSIQNSSGTVQQTIKFNELNKFQAGEHFLLSEERRIAWKIAIFELHVNKDIFSNHIFTLNPSSRNENTKNRFYEVSLDVKRTFPSINQLNKQHVALVLQNLTLYFEGVGYTQGMNFHVGFLLLCGFKPLEVYQIFIRLSYNKKYLLIRNFCQDFKNVNGCIKVMEFIIKNGYNEQLKLIKTKIESFGATFFLFVFSWFLTYFLYNFNIKASVLIWDYLIMFSPFERSYQNSQTPNNSKFGSGLVNSINLTLRIIQSLSEKLLNCNDMGQIMEILRHNAIEQHLDEGKVQAILQKCRHQPFINWEGFKIVVKQQDNELYKLIDLQQGMLPTKQQEINQNTFDQFMSSCKYPKRKSNNLSSTNFQ